ncbi:MAG: hypothetical protein ACK5MH_10160 [Bacteroidales bacterium]
MNKNKIKYPKYNIEHNCLLALSLCRAKKSSQLIFKKRIVLTFKRENIEI